MYPALTDLDVNADKHIAPYRLLCVIIIYIEIEYNIIFIIFILFR